MSANWYVRHDERIYGPYDSQSLKQLADDGRVSRKTLVRKGTEGQWVRADCVKGLFTASTSSAPGASGSTSPDPHDEHIKQPNTVPPPSGDAAQAIPPFIDDPSAPQSTETSAATRGNKMMWLIGGGVALVVLSITTLTIVVGLLGTTYFRKTDEEALAHEKQRLAAEAKTNQDAEEKRKEQQEREAWLSANFDSELAKKIRASAPSPDSLLLKKLTYYRLETVPADWSKQSTTVHSRIYSGRPDHGSPFLLDNNTLAMVVTTGALHFELWHIDLRTGAFRKITDFKRGRNEGKYYSVTWHKDNGAVVGQFIHLATTEQKRTPKFQGVATFGWLDLATGKNRGQIVRDKTNQSRDFLLEKLLKPQLPPTTQIRLTSGPMALSQANTKLAATGLQFDANRAALELDPALKQDWYKELNSFQLSDNLASSKLTRVNSTVISAPDCPLTDQLRPALQFAIAATDEDQSAMKAFIQGNSGHYMRNHGTLELLHLVATQSNKFSNYLTFQEQDPGTAARDLAILRIHEIAYAKTSREATIQIFDDFMSAFPGAQQWKDAYQNAYDLELERARFEVDHGANSDEKREQVANSFYVQWRDNLRDGKMPKAERLWRILTDEPDFNRTKAATEAQNAKDRDIYRRKMLALQEERNRILERIEGRLGDIAAGIDALNSTLQQTNAKLDQIAYNIDYGFDRLVDTFGN